MKKKTLLPQLTESIKRPSINVPSSPMPELGGVETAIYIPGLGGVLQGIPFASDDAL
ncbi:MULTISPECIES: hypothetical protein [Microcystis]|nr:MULTISPECIES: hypothetical protein [Microcystis]MCA2728484.1 hypothetical protein [Microcystis sp. M162S2]MCA2767841.1 hypothetical protein [Microcystis sp. M152S2]MCA2898224.1 hypothetical protein [Microcystis sp. M039S1]MCA2903393.1 hypothetical protein [Microcystis sp. M035S1]MCA2724793.1 hypothetical protein [Microcystis sp. M166S2]